MSFVFVGGLGLLFEKHGTEIPQSAQDVIVSLCEVGLLHGLDEFCCFKEFESSRIELRVHRRFSSEHHCSQCGVIQAGLVFEKCKEVGCGGILAPTSRAEEPAGDDPSQVREVDDLISTCTSDSSTCA